MINDRAKRILSEGASADEERNIVFLEEGGLSYIFKLFRAGEDAGVIGGGKLDHVGG